VSSAPQPVPQYPAPIRPSFPLDQYASIGAMVHARAAELGDAPACAICLANGVTGELSFAEVDRRSDELAAYFRAVLGAAPGERVAVLLPNCLAYPVAAFAVLKAGLALTAVNPLYTAEEIAAQLRDARPAVLVTLDLLGPRVEEALRTASVPHVVCASVGEFLPPLSGAFVRAALRVTRKRRGLPRAWTAFGAAVAAGRRALAADPGLAARTLGAVRPEHTALLQYTGGTTGIPKAAVLTHHNLLANTAQLSEIAGYYWDRRHDRMLTVLPLYHIFAFQINCLICFWQGCPSVLVPNPKPLANLAPAFRKFGITYATAVNTLLKLLLREPWFRADPPRNLRLVYAGGAAVEDAVVREWAEVTGGHVTQGYGLTEASPCVTFDPIAEQAERDPSGRPRLAPLDPLAEGLGLPMPMTEVRIVADDGRVLPPGESGEIEVRGPQVMSCYWEQPAETAAVFHDGWLRTGDIGLLSAAGRVTILDRKKDLVLVSGFNVFPNQVEDALVTHEHVSEAAVVGVPDELTGEAVVAFVVCPGGLTDECVLRDHCRAYLAGYKVPRHVLFRAELPKTAIGKIDRKALRAEARKLFARA